MGTIFTLFSVLSSYIFSTGSKFVLDAQENCGRVVRERFWHCFEPIFNNNYVCVFEEEYVRRDEHPEATVSNGTRF